MVQIEYRSCEPHSIIVRETFDAGLNFVRAPAAACYVGKVPPELNKRLRLISI